MIWPGSVPTCSTTNQPCACPEHKNEATPDAWVCEKSPDGYCHYTWDLNLDGTLCLYDGRTVTPPRPAENTLEEQCLYCEEPEDRQ